MPLDTMKILIEAYACEPEAGSEPGVGWHWARQAALHGHEVHVLTRANNRESIERSLRNEPIRGLHFHYYDLPGWVQRLKKHTGYYGLLTYYYLWQLGVWFVIKGLSRRHTFDLAHHVTFVNDWMPSAACGTSAPLVWGPVGGSTHVMPRNLITRLPAYARRYEFVRRALQLTMWSFDPFLKITRNRASVILVYTQEAMEGIPRKHRHKARSIIHIGVADELSYSNKGTENSPPVTTGGPRLGLTILSGGRLVHWKGLDLLIEGFARSECAKAPQARILFTGEGRYRATLEDIAQRLEVADRVEFLGHLPSHRDVLRLLRSCDLFALPTLRDGPPVAILEAMHAAKPVLCLDLGATRELVPPSAGIKVPFRDHDQVIDDISRELTWAQAHRADLTEMGQRGRDHTLAVHDWGRIGDEVNAVYESLGFDG
jgi:glycosyltransferase involved in cell wall biosynthesis